MNKLLKQLGLKEAWGLDWETYWSKDFTLKKLPTTEYITDERFETQLVAVQKHSWKKAKVMEAKEFAKFAKTVDWSQAAMLAHHAHFDGLIASHHFCVEPAFYFDTLSMARAVMPIQVGGSLNKVATAFGLPGKRYGDALVNTMGKHWDEFTAEEKRALKQYAGDDIEQTWAIFHKLLPFVPFDELRLIDMTVKLYAQPRLLLDEAALRKLAEDTLTEKQRLLDSAAADRSLLMSNDKFAELLRAEGVEPPTKISKTTGKETYAFSKQDLDFKALLDHPNDRVSTLVEARLGVKSTIVETRAQRMADRAKIGPQPIYLNYWGAGTGRWSGGDSINYQNMTRGSVMRTSIIAPPGYSLIIADQAQIEARLNAWFSGQQNIVDAFAEGQDIYALAASLIYNRQIDKERDPQERFVGKVATLALGYQAGWSRFAEMLRIGAFGPPLNIKDDEAQAAHRGWRQANPFIVANWKATENKLRAAFTGKTSIEDRCVSYEGVGQNGYMHLPNGTAIRYDGVEVNEDGQLEYIQKYRANSKTKPTILRTKLYGGIAVENRTQALGRCIIGENMLAIADILGKDWRLVMTTHDEIVGIVPDKKAKKALKEVIKVMTTPPEWAKGLPLGVDAHISKRYDK